LRSQSARPYLWIKISGLIPEPPVDFDGLTIDIEPDMIPEKVIKALESDYLSYLQKKGS
jgi:hypothetical protein